MARGWVVELIEKPESGPHSRTLYYAAIPVLETALEFVRNRAKPGVPAEAILKSPLSESQAKELMTEHGLKPGRAIQWGGKVTSGP
jgi:hypothetical protein